MESRENDIPVEDSAQPEKPRTFVVNVEDALELPLPDPDELVRKAREELRAAGSDAARLEIVQSEALGAWRRLLLLGTGAEERHAANYLAAATGLLQVALEAQKARMKAAIDIRRLEIEEQKLELARRKLDLMCLELRPDTEEDPSSLVDRNALVRAFLRKDVSTDDESPCGSEDDGRTESEGDRGDPA